jgi:Fe-S cluster biosynthesis and repair protein YggX
LQKQTQIINHYGLDLTNPDAQTFLFDNIKGFLFGEVPNVAEIDTTKEGTVKW